LTPPATSPYTRSIMSGLVAKRIRKASKIAQVVPIRAQAVTPVDSGDARRITQERLRKGAELLAQEYQIIRALRQFTMDIEADLRAGASLETGELTFDRELKVVRQQIRNSTALRKFPARA
jgi:hypothetical protein